MPQPMAKGSRPVRHNTSPLQSRADAARLVIMLDRTKAAELAAVLEWYRDMGAEEAVGEAPVDWLKRGGATPGSGFALLGSATPAEGPQANVPSAGSSRPAAPVRR